MKKIGLICLCLASLTLVGCFHVPDEDWLPSKNRIDTGNIQKEDEVENAINSFVDGINMVSSQRDEMKNDEDEEVDNQELEDIEVEESAENETGETIEEYTNSEEGA